MQDSQLHGRPDEGSDSGCEVEEPVVLENHPNDSRVKIKHDGIVQALSGRMGTGGNNTPLAMVSDYIPFRKTAHPRNSEEPQGWEETEVNDTLNQFDIGENRTTTIAVKKDTGSHSVNVERERESGSPS